MASTDQKQTKRKVRFTLPTAEDFGRWSSVRGRSLTKKPPIVTPPESIATKVDENKVHGTAKYINGTLNFSTADYKSVPAAKNGSSDGSGEARKEDRHKFKPKLLTSCLSAHKKKPTESAVNANVVKAAGNVVPVRGNIPPNDDISIQTEYKKDFMPKLNYFTKALHRQINRVPKSCAGTKKRAKTKKFTFFSPACLKRRKPTVLKPARRKRKIGDRIPNQLNVPAFTAMQKLSYQLYNNHEDTKNNTINRHLKQLRIQREENGGDREVLLLTDGEEDDDNDEDEEKRIEREATAVYAVAGDERERHQQNEQRKHGPEHAVIQSQLPSQAPIELSRDNSVSSFLEFVQRWRRVQNQSLARLNHWTGKQTTGVSVDVSGFKNSDVKS